MDSLLRQAAGLEAPSLNDWQSLHAPATDLLPPIVCRSPSAALSPRTQGLKRYMWVAFHTALDKARTVYSSAPSELVLMDDLHLAQSHYPQPIARVVHKIDFLALPESRAVLKEKLTNLGWHESCDGEHPYSEFRYEGETILRLHWQWFAPWPVHPAATFERAADCEGFRALSPLDQLGRVCWFGADHLWLLDAHTLLVKQPQLATQLATRWPFMNRRWEQLANRRLGKSLDLGTRLDGRYTFAQKVLGFTHRSSNRYTAAAARLALDLVQRRNCGRRPGEWISALCRLWSLATPQQLPAEFLARWRSRKS